MKSKCHFFFSLFMVAMILQTSLTHAQQTYQLDWGFNINGANASLTIEQGDTVEWTWIDTGQHNIVNTANAVETFDSGLLQGIGTTFSHTFTEIGVNDYECSPHNSNMFGTITVTAPASNDFYLAPNGVTCMCPNAAVGDSGDPGNGIVYTKRTRNQITPQNAATTCTSGITDMSYLFSNITTFNSDISSWDVSSVTNMTNIFTGNLLFNQDISFWDVGSVITMYGMFSDASSFNQNIGSWDVSSVQDFMYMFNNATEFNQPLGSWDVSQANIMEGMFKGTYQNPTAFNQPINSWNVSSVTNMAQMFSDSSFNQPLNNWDTSAVNNFSSMFSGSSSFNQQLSTWNVSAGINFQYMFAGNLVFDQPLNNWNMSSAFDLTSMFSEAVSFNQPLNDWNVSNVWYFHGMFSNSSFNQPLNGWVTSSAREMQYMFGFNTSFNQDISLWDVSNVVTMEGMFENAISFNQNIDSWDVSSTINMGNMFNSCQEGNGSFNQDLSSWNFNSSVFLGGIFNCSSVDVDNYDVLLQSMYNQPLVNKEFGDFSLVYCNQQDHDALISEKGWTFDGGQLSLIGIIAPESIISEPDPGACIATNLELGTPDVFGCGTLIVSNDAPAEFPLGVTQVTWTVTDANGNTETSLQIVEIELISDEAEVCYASADQNQPQNNRVYITSDPALNGQNVDFHEVLRETPSGGYETIGFIVPPEDSYLDATSDNSTQAYRYKVQTTDVCGQVLTLSDFHKTILLQSSIATNNSVNLAWNPYIGVAFNTYNIYRSVNGANYELLTSISSTNTSYNDTSANVVDNFYEYYISIDVASCSTDPFQSFELESNREYINPNLALVDQEWLKNSIVFYPNPSLGKVNVSVSEGIVLKNMAVYSALGQVILETSMSEKLDLSSLPAGIYYINTLTNKGSVTHSLIKQ
jgi:surface protein